MRKFFNVGDIGDIAAALEEAREVKKNRFAWKHLGENRTIMLVFFNSSLRTRLSSQKAATNLGMNPIVLNIGQESWKLETELGWKPQYTFDTGIQMTIQWYLDNKEWWENIISGEYRNYFAEMYKDRVE